MAVQIASDRFDRIFDRETELESLKNEKKRVFPLVSETLVQEKCFNL